MKPAFAIVCLILLVGCGSTPRVVPRYPEPELKVPNGQTFGENQGPGALWSESSSWNRVYTGSQSRVTGDILTIRLESSFRNLLAARLKAITPQEDQEELFGMMYLDPKKAEQKDKAPEPAKAAQAGEGATPSGKELQYSTLKLMSATVQKVQPRGMYDVVGYRIFPGRENRIPIVILRGKVRDRELDINEGISSDDVLNLEALVGYVDGRRS